MESASRDIHDLRKSPLTVQKGQVQRVETRHRPQNRQCYHCDSTDHIATECRFLKVTCRACGKKGHLAKVCRSKGKFQPPVSSGQQGPKVNSIESQCT